MKIVIVGGGTAGWITTFMLSKIRPNHEYINISSSKIPTVGVGEGVTGVFRRILTEPFFEINEFDFIKKANVIPKLGVKFNNWTSKGSSFFSPIEGTTTSGNFLDSTLFYSILKDKDVDDSSATGYLSNRDRTSFFIENGGINFYDYGLHSYHLDNYKTGEYFRDLSINNGVSVIDSTIKEVSIEEEKIKSVTLENGSVVEGDLFFDCSGYARILSKKLDVETKDYSDYLPLNECIVFDVLDENPKKHAYTNANAMNAGWMFEIFKQYSTQRGYVFCDKFLDKDGAIEEVEEYFGSKIKVKNNWKFKSNRLKKSINGNCVSIGLANLSVEPMQATQIHCAVCQINDFIRNCFNDDIDRTLSAGVVDGYNNRTAKLCDNMVDFISLHYTGGRTDTEFWNYVTNEKPDTDKVSEILSLGKERLTRWDDFDTFYGSTNQILWNPVLAGLGHFDKETIESVFKTWNIPEEILEEELNNHLDKISSFYRVSSSIETFIDFVN